jgi:hypothetical protein
MSESLPDSSWLDSLLSAEPAEQEALVRTLPPNQLAQLLASLPLWVPQSGPQTEAFHSPADILFYGGQAGGGKTDLALGLACTSHYRSIIFRREYPRLKALIARSREIYAPAAPRGFNASEHTWTFPDGRVIELGSMPNETDAQAYQGNPHDLYVFDELPEFTESQFRFVIGWLRSTRPGQRCRVVCPGNPPTDSNGEWVTRFFAPWLDTNHPRPARPGELRWFTTGKDGKDIEVDASWRDVDEEGQPIVPLSRTFIPAKLSDNRYQPASYRAVLQSLPEPLRSKLLYGDFKAGREDSAYQVIPSAWVMAAQARWTPDGHRGRPMAAIGVDVARGGKDKTTLAPRHANWFAPLLAFPGSSTPDGPAVAALVIQHRRDNAVVNIDVIAVGSSPYDSLRVSLKDRAVAMNASEGSDQHDKSGQLGFVNQRAEWWWKLREALDPASEQDLALPPDPELRADLCAPHWKLTARGIQIEAKDEIHKRIGRSPDRGDAVVMAHAIRRIPGQGFLELMEQDIAAQAAKAKEQR